ncbi:MAG: hypothetical protein QM752_06420 [Gammaproteobacteria bacterium]
MVNSLEDAIQNNRLELAEYLSKQLGVKTTVINKMLNAELRRSAFFQKKKSQEQEKKVSSSSKAFLITGGTQESRNEKYKELFNVDPLSMCSTYEKEDELAVFFSSKHEDFEGMTFEKTKKLAGSSVLSSNFLTIHSRGPKSGIINLPFPENQSEKSSSLLYESELRLIGQLS